MSRRAIVWTAVAIAAAWISGFGFGTAWCGSQDTETDPATVERPPTCPPETCTIYQG